MTHEELYNEILKYLNDLKYEKGYENHECINDLLSLINRVGEEITICDLVDIDQTSDFADGMRFQSMESLQRLSLLTGKDTK